jgi:hypothetical protein
MSFAHGEAKAINWRLSLRFPDAVFETGLKISSASWMCLFGPDWAYFLSKSG